MDPQEQEVQKQYVLEDIMRKRRKNQQAIQNKLRNKLTLKGKRKKNQDAVKAPEKFIKQYRAAQKSYAYYKHKNHNVLNHLRISSQSENQGFGFGKLLFVVRIRGVKDISTQQKLLLNKLNLRQVNTAVFLKGTKANITTLKRIENYITWGEASKKLVTDLIYKKMYGKINNERVQIRSNEQVQQNIGGEILCLEDIINEVVRLGPQFSEITEFIFPFKLTTPEGTLASRLRKPVGDNGHWGYRGQQINEYAELMI